MKLKMAGDLIKEIAANINDQGLVSEYMKEREKLELLDSVRQLALKLA